MGIKKLNHVFAIEFSKRGRFLWIWWRGRRRRIIIITRTVIIIEQSERRLRGLRESFLEEIEFYWKIRWWVKW